MKYAQAPFPDLLVLASAVAGLERVPVDYEQLTAAVNGLHSYLAREPSLDQWTALTSLGLELGIESIGTSHFLRLFNVGDDARAAAAFRNLPGDTARRATELRLLFPQGDTP